MEKSERKRPVHLPDIVRHQTPVIVFVTVCVADRAENTFASDAMHQALRNAWAAARSHLVGAYVLMPDHLHLFCAPASTDAENVAKWVRYWKSVVAREVRGRPVGGACACTPRRMDEQTLLRQGYAGQALVPPVLRLDVRNMDEQALVPSSNVRSGEGRASARPDACVSPVFQRDCWDTQLRRGESYHEKWEYVRNNPVRRGLVGQADAWPYWGVINELVW